LKYARRKQFDRMLSFRKGEQFYTDAIGGRAHIILWEPIPGGSPDVVLYPDVAAFADNRFDCCHLLQRSVIHYGACKASATIEDQA
jgi:hypothetical protein